MFDCLEARGVDASGVWATEQNKSNRVIYHKEPIRSSEFVKKDFWKSLKKVKTNLMLVHSRATSRGGGHARTNSNNHPFVSADKRIGMVHNGTLSEAHFLKDKYQILSETDSEYILRMYEHGMDGEDFEIKDSDGVPKEISDRIKGIKDVWSVVSSGAMAVAIGERIDDNSRYLFLFRNKQRPLWLADMRSALGQVFFFSSPEIWYRAVSQIDIKDICSGAEKLIEVPIKQVWVFSIDEENQTVNPSSDFYRFNFDISDAGEKWKSEGVKVVKEPKQKISLLSMLDDNEEISVDKPKTRKTKTVDHDPDEYTEPFPGAALSDHGGTEHENVCKQIIDLANSIEICTNNSVMEGSLSPHDYMEILESLEQTRVDLEGTLRLIEQ